MWAPFILLPLAIGSPVPDPKRGRTCPEVQIQPDTGSEITIKGVFSPEFNQDWYLGIPFAAPPVGDLRFAPPQNISYSDTTTSIIAQTQPPTCLQDPKNPEVGIYGSSEDCLFLNVLTPAGLTPLDEEEACEGLPVMVWVYGGSFQIGGASLYNGTFIVQQSVDMGTPVIYVAMNYRLGILGWGQGDDIAAHGAANLGLRDVIKAMKWVQDNIAAFGGDPNKVTVFGESAGAITVSLLLLQPNTTLFRSAIIQSGAPSTLPAGPSATTWQKPYDDLLVFANCSNATDQFECLKYLPAEDLIAAQTELIAETEYYDTFMFGASVDGDLVPEQPFNLLEQGRFANVSILTGNTYDEGTEFIPTSIGSERKDVERLLINFEPDMLNKDVLDALFILYPDIPELGSPFDTGNETFGLNSTYKQVAAIFGDIAFQAPRRHFLESFAKIYPQTKTWSYLFNQTTDFLPYYGVAHTAEVPFLFNTPIELAFDATNYTSAGKDGYEMGMQMRAYWINFAVYTDPNGYNPISDGSTINGEILPYWRTYDLEAKALMRFKIDELDLVRDDFREEGIAFFNSMPKDFNYRRGLPRST